MQHLDESLAIGLGAGEREAISLALELHADVLLIDGFLGRQQAEARHILLSAERMPTIINSYAFRTMGIVFRSRRNLRIDTPSVFATALSWQSHPHSRQWFKS